MARQQDFVIDKLTNSIENVQTGDKHETEIVPVTAADLKRVHKKAGWAFLTGKPSLRIPRRKSLN